MKKLLYRSATGILCLSAASLALTQFSAEGMTTYTVKAGRHFSFPRVIKWKRAPSAVSWDVIFNEDCNYQHLKTNGNIHEDQKDWNKLCGVFYTLFSTHGESAMMGWRYDPATDLIELAPYYHISNGRDMFPSHLAVPRGELINVTIEVDYEEKQYHWILQHGKRAAEHRMPFTHNKRTCSFINFYFGGNRTAPQTVSAQMRMTIK